MRLKLSVSQGNIEIVMWSHKLPSSSLHNQKYLADTYVDMMNFKQPTNQSAMEYTQTLRTRPLRCIRVYGKYRLKGKIIEGLRQSIQESLESYWAKTKSAYIQ